MIILDGKIVAQVRRESLKKKVESFRVKAGRAPGLAVILVGDDPASEVYVKNKIAACEQVGIHSTEFRLKKASTQEEVKSTIQKLNSDKNVDGILLQLPLPSHLSGEALTDEISPNKDPDGLTTLNLGRLIKGQPLVASCTPLGVMKILEHFNISISGKRAVVVGRSAIVGKPMAQLLLAADATVTMAHSKTLNLESLTREADIVVVAAGKPQFLGKTAFKKGAIVIDVGMHRKLEGTKTKLVGDVDPSGLEDIVQALTPVPGGVGPMTITMLLENTLTLAAHSLGS